MKFLLTFDNSNVITNVGIVSDNATTVNPTMTVLPFTALPSGVTVGTFLNNYEKYRIVAGNSIQQVPATSLVNRIISSPDNTVPLTLARANTITNLSVL